MEAATPSDSPTIIRPINKGVVHRICAGQVILDLSSAVKELVENSLDAGATSIEIALKDYGKECFQVIDNGSGISPNNFKVLALKHHTSKLGDFPDLQSLTTFGFRGEALSSLCVLGNLTVETRTKYESVATHLTYDRTGLLVAEKKTARQIGTTVTVNSLFSSLPVRCKEFTRNIRKEYGKLISLLNAYALIAKGVRLVCTNKTGKSVKSVVLKTQGSGSLKDNIITLFGMNTFNCLQPLTLCISDGCEVDGFVSKPGQGNGRNIGDRQFFYVNGRPVDMPKITKLVNELYRSANSQQHPVAILNFTVPTRACDVNVTPDKRKVFFSDENTILHALREGLQQIYSSSNACYAVNKAEELTMETGRSQLCSPHQKSHVVVKPLSKDESSPEEVQDEDGNLEVQSHVKTVETDVKDTHIIESVSGDNIMRDFALGVHSINKGEDTSQLMTHNDSIISSQNTISFSKMVKDSYSHSSVVQSSLDKFVTVNKRKHECISTILSEVPVLRNQTLQFQSKSSNFEDNAAVSRSPSPQQVEDSAKVEMLSKMPVLRNQTLQFQSENRNDKSKFAVSRFASPCQVDDSADIEMLSEVPVLRKHSLYFQSKNSIVENDAKVSRSPCPHRVDDSAEVEESHASKYIREEKISNKIVNALASVCDTDNGEPPEDIDTHEKGVPVANITSIASSSGDLELLPEDGSVDVPLHSSSIRIDAQKPSSDLKICSTVQFSIQDLKTKRQKMVSQLQSSKYICQRRKTKRCYTAATLELSQPEDEERKAKALVAATTELEKLFRKEDFSRMKVIGQFNLGFIIGKLDQDLFIVDQHAADEKYNFERLSQSTILNVQPLLRPLRLELSPAEEVVASMHIDIIRKNGFALEEDPDAPPGHQFRLKAVPFSKNITFGVEDVKDLISTLADDHGECTMIGTYKMDTPNSVCPPRVRGMLASRACRSSVMIGDALGRNEMQKIIGHLAKLNSPWNCPHGRPTMRHLIDLTSIYKRSEE
ncbi:DNA mismatch repair protein PMS1 [Ziziphus jujuba]|uniref:DNA mismatch repair protein PMS1 n=1 Tax=Ziziphus jujuba TaxID=326968 RepID=A0ABM3IX32_ZIZJJ|nr:DNA mismatch repair protein PMS1 [Ziziphus jujuba]